MLSYPSTILGRSPLPHRPSTILGCSSAAPLLRPARLAAASPPSFARCPGQAQASRRRPLRVEINGASPPPTLPPLPVALARPKPLIVDWSAQVPPCAARSSPLVAQSILLLCSHWAPWRCRSGLPFPDPASSSDNVNIDVKVDGKFEHGYIVTVIMGSRSTKAVLYNCTEEQALPTLKPPVASNSTDLKGIGLPASTTAASFGKVNSSKLPEYIVEDLATALLNSFTYNIGQAYEKCFQNLQYMERYEDHTIAHAIQAKYEKTKIYLWPGQMRSGLSTAGRTVETMLYLAGFSNVKTKVIGSRNQLNIGTPKDVRQKFGRTVVESYLL